jgi:hypothetical protein
LTGRIISLAPWLGGRQIARREPCTTIAQLIELPGRMEVLQ